jgi:hypothetical protein
MALEAPGRYLTKKWIIVHTKKTLAICRLDMGLRMRLFSLLENVPDPFDDEYDAFENQELVVLGLVADLSMPSGYWHRETGKCLWGNAAIGDKPQKSQEKFFSRFDIQL